MGHIMGGADEALGAGAAAHEGFKFAMTVVE